MNMIMLTEDGLKDLRMKYDHLKTTLRPSVIEEMKNAKEANNCDISENNEYLEACSQLNQIESKMSEIGLTIANSRIIKISDIIDDGTVKFGCTVKLLRLDNNKEYTFKIVGAEESNIKEGKISYLAPLAQEMNKLSKEDFVECQSIEYEILSVKII